MHTYELCQCRSIPEVYAKQWRLLWWFSVRSSLSSINEDLCASDLQGSAGKWYQKGNKKTWKPYVIWAIMHMDIGLTIYKLWRCLNLLIITPDIFLNNKKSLYVRLYFYTGAGDRTWTCTREAQTDKESVILSPKKRPEEARRPKHWVASAASFRPAWKSRFPPASWDITRVRAWNIRV